MIPGRIEGANVTLGAPEGYTGKCSPLHILAEDAPNGSLYLSSVWFPTPEELAALAAGAPVRLTMHSSRHPPVKLGVGEVPA